MKGRSLEDIHPRIASLTEWSHYDEAMAFVLALKDNKFTCSLDISSLI